MRRNLKNNMRKDNVASWCVWGQEEITQEQISPGWTRRGGCRKSLLSGLQQRRGLMRTLRTNVYWMRGEEQGAGPKLCSPRGSCCVWGPQTKDGEITLEKTLWAGVDQRCGRQRLVRTRDDVTWWSLYCILFHTCMIISHLKPTAHTGLEGGVKPQLSPDIPATYFWSFTPPPHTAHRS